MHATKGKVRDLAQAILINIQVDFETIGAFKLSVRTCFNVLISIRILSRATTRHLIGLTLFGFDDTNINDAGVA